MEMVLSLGPDFPFLYHYYLIPNQALLEASGPECIQERIHKDPEIFGEGK